MNTALVIALAFSCVIAISAIESNNCGKCNASTKKPICAVNDDGELQTFGNLCAMATSNCFKKTTFKVVMADGNCDATWSCSDICSVDDPICGKQQVTGALKNFASDCQRRTENCYSRPGYDFAYYGVC